MSSYVFPSDQRFNFEIQLAQIKEGLMKGGMFLGASFKKAAMAASAGIAIAKAKAESSITPETKAKIEAAATAARGKLDDVGKAAGRAASSECLLQP